MSRGLSTALMVAGGALNGAGEGILFQIKSMREQALKQLEIDAADRRNQQDIASRENIAKTDREARSDDVHAQIGAQQFDTLAQIAGAEKRTGDTNASEERRTGAEIAGRRGLLSKTFIGEDGHEKGITAGGDTIDMGPAAKTKDMTSEEKAILEGAIKASTEVDQNTGKSAVNPDKLAGMLQKASTPALRNFGKMVSAGGAVPGPDEFPGQTSSGIGDVDADSPASATVTPQDKGSDLPQTAADTDPAKEAEAEQIRSDFKAGKISRDEANKRLNKLLGG
jgi:hypothetical protein